MKKIKLLLVLFVIGSYLAKAETSTLDILLNWQMPHII